MFSTPFSFSSLPKYDLFFSGNIKITNNKIEFKCYNDLLIYTSWSHDKKLTDTRDINIFSSIKNWVEIHFNNYNKGNPKILYNPTVLMQIGYKNYIFVLKNASYNESRKYKLIFNISTKEINSKIKKKIPKGKFNRVRFDIDSFDKKCGNLINGLVPRLFVDKEIFEKEKIHYNNNINNILINDLDLDVLILRNKTRDVEKKTFIIETNIEIFDQKETNTCGANIASLLYIYTYVTKGVTFNTNFTTSGDLRPFTNIWLDPYNSPLIINSSMFFASLLNFKQDSYFSRSFIMWISYYTPLGSYEYKNNITFRPSLISGTSMVYGTSVLNTLIGLQTWGCVEIKYGDNYFNNPAFFKLVNYTDTTFAKPLTQSVFGSSEYDVSLIDKLTKDQFNEIVTKFNNVYNPKWWPIQKDNNFKIYLVPQKQDIIISVLDQMYIINIAITIINYNYDFGADNKKKKGMGICLEYRDNLDYVLKYTDFNQTENNIQPVYHGVVIVGYTNNTDSGDYYVKVVNSWGESFGDKGHFWMPMSFVTNSTYCSSLYTIALSTDTINIPGVTTN